MVVLASNPKNSVVFFDVTNGRQELGHMKLELFADLVPKRTENFRWCSHWLQSGPSTNSYQFFITCSKCDWLNGIHVVFSKIIDGLLIMRKIENVSTGLNNKPKLLVVIAQCG
uniref:Peptidyl-prolyl cis-trans isomerase n=1 Tax=Pseudonaja textilis TaxID=8673 RepID=A0A670YJM2_PSETE